MDRFRSISPSTPVVIFNMTSRLDSLREALAVSPQNIPLLFLFGQACLDELSFEEARSAFDRILQTDASHDQAKLGIARLLYLSGNTSEAVVRTEALTKANPAFAEAWMLLSRLAVAEGDCASATQYYQKAIKLNPGLSDPAIERDVPIGSQGIHLVEEKNCRRIFAGQLKRLVQVFFAIADVQIQDLMDADRDEIGLNFARCRLADQRFAATRRSIQQYTATKLFAVRFEESTVLQRVNDLHPDLLLDVFHATHIRERDFRLLDVRRDAVFRFELTREFPGI